ncbi:MAG: hypothetical protein MJZ32_09730 [Bacteroidaceae bacterium]|nr:hypothetical protein [Bacteroidaceae bacterium]
MKKHYYKNEAQENLKMGLITSALIACMGALFIVLMEIIDGESAIIKHYLGREYFMLPFVAIGTIIFLILRIRMRKKLYNQVESALDD